MKISKSLIIVAVLTLLAIGGFIAHLSNKLYYQKSEKQDDAKIKSLLLQARNLGLNQPVAALLPQPSTVPLSQNSYYVYLKHQHDLRNAQKAMQMEKKWRALQTIHDISWPGYSAEYLRDLASKLTHEIAIIKRASLLPYFYAHHDLNHPDVILFPEFAIAESCAKLILLDMRVGLFAKDRARVTNDNAVLQKIAHQITDEKLSISLLFAKNIKTWGLDLLWTDMILHPLSHWEPSYYLSLATKLKEPSMLQDSSLDFASFASLATLFESENRLKIASELGLTSTGIDDLGSTYQYQKEHLGLHVARHILQVALKTINASRYQFNDIEKMTSEVRDATNEFSSLGGPEELVGQLMASPGEYYYRFGRLLQSMKEAFAQAVVTRNQSGSWPDHLVFPPHYFIPPKLPFSTVADAHGMNTASPINPFTKLPIEFKKFGHGFALIGEYPDAIGSRSQTEVSAITGSMKPAIVIEWTGAKVVTINLN